MPDVVIGMTIGHKEHHVHAETFVSTGGAVAKVTGEKVPVSDHLAHGATPFEGSECTDVGVP